MADKSQYVTLGVARDLFAVPVGQVQEILEMRVIARLPHAPSWFLGLIDVRGTSVPVIDLRLRLGLPPAEDALTTRVVVLSATVAGTSLILGLRADRVFEVTVMDEDALEPPPQIGVRWRSEAIAGIGRRKGEFVAVLDLEHLFSADELAPLTAAAQAA